MNNPDRDSGSGRRLVGFFDSVEKRVYFVPPLNRKNPYQQKRLATRCMEQLGVEGVAAYSRIGTSLVRGYSRTLRRRGIRYRAFPQCDGVTIVLSILGTTELPGEAAKRQRLLITWIAGIPDGRRIGGSNDFGGECAGFNFRSREPGRHIKLDWDVGMGQVIGALEMDECEWFKDNHDNVMILGMGDNEAKEYVRDRFIS